MAAHAALITILGGISAIDAAIAFGAGQLPDPGSGLGMTRVLLLLSYLCGLGLYVASSPSPRPAPALWAGLAGAPIAAVHLSAYLSHGTDHPIVQAVEFAYLVIPILVTLLLLAQWLIAWRRGTRLPRIKSALCLALVIIIATQVLLHAALFAPGGQRHLQAGRFGGAPGSQPFRPIALFS